MSPIRLLFLLVGVLFVSISSAQTPAPPPPPTTTPPTNSIRMELFIRSDSDLTKPTLEFAEKFAAQRNGLELIVHDVINDRDQLARLWEITKRSERDKPVVPAFYCCDRMYFGFVSPEQTGPSIERLLTVDVYTRATCPKCIRAKAFLKKLEPRWPALRFRIYDVTYDSAARGRWQSICRSQGKPPGLPTFDFSGQVIIGYQGDDITGVQLENLVHRVAKNQSGQRETTPRPNDSSIRLSPSQDRAFASIASSWHGLTFLLQAEPQSEIESTQQAEAESERTPVQDAESGPGQTPPETEPAPDLDLDALLLPEDAGAGDIGEAELETSQPETESATDVIDVPLLGELRPSELGFPTFTFLVGLIDGFNPCAMWVLVFLLSVLVNIRDRRKILLIAGTFVVVSGAAYFTFMAAWLSLFLLIGIVRPVQIILALMAILIGAVNVKDFFAFKKGISFSIPESSKPGLYKRVRGIMSAKYMTAALVGVVVLAVIVNMVELLCTAGLPALYTQVLTMQEFPIWKNYAYLGLYISAYMLDDTVLLGIVVVTLSHRKLQEREGRWLKLISGLVILALGLVMLIKPEWLQLGQ